MFVMSRRSKRVACHAVLAAGAALAWGAAPASAAAEVCATSVFTKNPDRPGWVIAAANSVYIPTWKMVGGLDIDASTCAIRWPDGAMKTWVHIQWRTKFGYDPLQDKRVERFRIWTRAERYGVPASTWKECDVTASVNANKEGAAICEIVPRSDRRLRGYSADGSLDFTLARKPQRGVRRDQLGKRYVKNLYGSPRI